MYSKYIILVEKGPILTKPHHFVLPSNSSITPTLFYHHTSTH